MSEDLTIEYVKALLDLRDERLNGMDRVQLLQSKELARRLEELTHAHRQMLDDRNLFVTKDEYHSGHVALSNTVDTLRDTVNQWRGRDMMVAVGASAVLSLIMLAIAHFWR